MPTAVPSDLLTASGIDTSRGGQCIGLCACVVPECTVLCVRSSKPTYSVSIHTGVGITASSSPLPRAVVRGNVLEKAESQHSEQVCLPEVKGSGLFNFVP